LVFNGEPTGNPLKELFYHFLYFFPCVYLFSF
jgi:hypothetical protein